MQNHPSKFIQISKIISNFFNPITSLFIFFIYRSSLLFSFKETIHLFFPILMLTAVPISLWIFWNVKKGKYTNMDVSNRNQRKGLYFFISGVLLVYFGYTYIFKNEIDLIMGFILILLWVLQISNYFIKSSMHTAFNVFVATLFFSLNPGLGVIWLGFAVLVGYTRIVLKRHSPKEVFTGAGIAVIISFIYLYTNIQIQQ